MSAVGLEVTEACTLFIQLHPIAAAAVKR